jgi:GntR family transcriptional regulator, galactonate operon transcriptional repressor
MQPPAPALQGSNLHERVTAELALRVIRGERNREPAAFPNEASLCQQLTVSRTVVREAMKVLADKGMVEMRPRIGTRARPRCHWKLLDPDILAWQADLEPDPQFLRDLCEVRLGIEPTASGFAAVRATGRELDGICQCLSEYEALARGVAFEKLIDADLSFHAAVVSASHNDLLKHISDSIRGPFRTALLYTSRHPANTVLALEAHLGLVKALQAHDPVAARKSAEEAIGLAMVAVEEGIRAQAKRRKPSRKP